MTTVTVKAYCQTLRLLRNEQLTSAEIAARTHCSLEAARERLAEMEREGFLRQAQDVEREGRGRRWRRWELHPDWKGGA